MIALLARWVLGPIVAVLEPLGRWLIADWRNGPLVVFGALFVAHVFLLDPHLRGERDEARAQFVAEKKAHDQTIADFVEASHEAERRQAANVERVQAEQVDITERIEHDYETRVADLRARAGALAERLRNPATVDPGASGEAGLPGSGTTARGLAETAGDHRLSASGFACDPLTLEQRLIASEQAVQLDALISWNIEQAAVATSPAEAAQ